MGKEPVHRGLQSFSQSKKQFLGKDVLGDSDQYLSKATKFGDTHKKYVQKSKELRDASQALVNSMDGTTVEHSHVIADMAMDTIAGALSGIVGTVKANEYRTGQNDILTTVLPGIVGSSINNMVNRNRVVGEWAQKVYVGDYGFDIVHDYKKKEGSFRFGNSNIFGGVGIGLVDGSVQNSWGVGNVYVNQVLDSSVKEVGTSVRVRDIGVAVDHSLTLQSTAVDVGTRQVHISTLFKLQDRDFGQRVKVKDTSVIVRHDFDKYLMDEGGNMASQVFVQHKNIGVGASLDYYTKAYAVSVGIGDITVATSRNFTSRSGTVNVSSIGGWNFTNAFDLPDNNGGSGILGLVGFGKTQTFWADFHGGIDDGGSPVGGLDIQTKNMGLSTAYANSGPRKVFLYTINVGNTIYSWESEVLPQNIHVLPIFGGILKSVIGKQ